MAEQLATQLRLQRSIERALGIFKKIGKGNLTPAKIRSRMSTLTDTWRQFQDGHDVLTRAIPSATKPSIDYFKDDHYDKTEEVYQSTLDAMSEWLEEMEPPASVNQFVGRGPAQTKRSVFSLSHFPPIRCPPFDGNYSEWENFRDRFTSLIINNSELNDLSRMHFLTLCLRDRALECISSIPVTAENFKTAWTTLTSRYDDKKRLLNVHLSNLTSVGAVLRESASNLQMLRDRVNIIVAALAGLGRTPAELWDDILVFLVAQRLDPVTRKAWNIRSNDNDDPPSFTELNRFLASRIRALEEFELNSSSLNKSAVKPENLLRINSTNATTNPASICSLCKAKHFISACPRFLSKSSGQRKKFVKQSKRCYNCLSKTHLVSECWSKHLCRLCQSKHHTLLHDGASSSSS